MKFRSAILGPHSETHWNYVKFEHENGSKFGPPRVNRDPNTQVMKFRSATSGPRPK